MMESWGFLPINAYPTSQSNRHLCKLRELQNDGMFLRAFFFFFKYLRQSLHTHSHVIDGLRSWEGCKREVEAMMRYFLPFYYTMALAGRIF